MSVQHVLMGVLAEGPAHGYDLKRAYDERFPGAKTLAYGQVYAAAAEAGEFGGEPRRVPREVFSTAARPNIVAAGSRRRPPRRRRP